MNQMKLETQEKFCAAFKNGLFASAGIKMDSDKYRKFTLRDAPIEPMSSQNLMARTLLGLDKLTDLNTQATRKKIQETFDNFGPKNSVAIDFDKYFFSVVKFESAVDSDGNFYPGIESRIQLLEAKIYVAQKELKANQNENLNTNQNENLNTNQNENLNINQNENLNTNQEINSLKAQVSNSNSFNENLKKIDSLKAQASNLNLVNDKKTYLNSLKVATIYLREKIKNTKNPFTKKTAKKKLHSLESVIQNLDSSSNSMKNQQTK